jgi:type VI secretion system protein ImpA
MPTPETVTVAALLEPLGGGSPAGESLMYSDVYDEIGRARRGGDRAQVGSDDGPARPPDWGSIVRLAADALTRRGKDLQVAVWLTEALTRLHGFAGLRDGLRVVHGFHQAFWDTFHPVVEDGDLGFRVGRLGFLNERLPEAVLAVPLTDPDASGAAYGWIDWKDSREVDNLALQSAERYQAALDAGRLTGEQFDKAVAAGSRRFYEALLADVSAALEACAALEAVAGERYGREAPSLLGLHQAIEDCRDVLDRIVREKRRLEPDEGDAAEAAPAPDGAPAPRPAAAGGRALPLEPVDRADAVKRLAAVAAFFKRTEPHSPVAYLVQRAIRWAEMPLEDWLQDVIGADDAALSRLKDTLGIKG